MGLRSLRLNKIELEEADWLERDIKLGDVEFILKISSLDKAPDPNGFNFGCI